MVNGVDGCEKKLLLQVRQHKKVFLRLVGFHAGVLGDDARAGARRIKKHAVEAADNFGKLPRVVVANDSVLGA